MSRSFALIGAIAHMPPMNEYSVCFVLGIAGVNILCLSVLCFKIRYILVRSERYRRENRQIKRYWIRCLRRHGVDMISRSSSVDIPKKPPSVWLAQWNEVVMKYHL